MPESARLLYRNVHIDEVQLAFNVAGLPYYHADEAFDWQMNGTALKEGYAMSINISDVEHVARLARLDLSEEEKEMFTAQLSAILKYAEKLNELDTDNVEPTTHVLHVSNVMREDEVKESLPIEKVLRNAPDDEDGQFKVPAVLE